MCYIRAPHNAAARVFVFAARRQVALVHSSMVVFVVVSFAVFVPGIRVRAVLARSAQDIRIAGVACRACCAISCDADCFDVCEYVSCEEL